MKKNHASQSGLFNPRVLIAFGLCSVGLLLAMFTFATTPLKDISGTSAETKAVTAAAPASMGGPTTNFSNGITFDHATWNDPIRMVGEPDIVIDSTGGIYVSGPGGSTTQASWFWKSTDKGLQWHLIGCPLKSNCQNGGGDTEIAIARNNDVFASDLQTLTCNSALRSYDQGATWLTSEGCFPGTDRQWMGVYDPNASATGRRVYLSANGQAQGAYFLVSTDNGVTYVPPDPVNNPDAGIGGDAIGRFAINPANGHIYLPGTSNTKVSLDGGVTFLNRPRPAGVQGNFFANIAIDTAGNLWQGWTAGSKAFISYSTNEGLSWSTPVQVSTGPASPVGTSPDLRQMLFPWTVAGDPGRVAIVYYATTNTGSASGFPGDVNALWHTYVAISTNAMSATPTWTQVQADEHVMHRATVCTGGFPGCLTANSDRSMADFFAVDKDPQGRIFIAYNENSDLSDVTQTGTEYIGKPIDAVIRLRTGPSLFAAQGNLLPDPTPANVAITSAVVSGGNLSVSGTHGLPPGNWASDAAGDAPFPVVPVASANHPALDILEASVGDDGTNITFKLKMADLSAMALADAATAGGTPTWMVTWWEGKNGLGPAGVTSGPFHSHWFVKWLGQNQFVYGKVGSIDSAALGAPTPKALTYVPSGTATGSVVGNVVTITVPLASVGPITAGDKIDHIIAYSLVEHADATVNDWADQVKSLSYVIGTPAAKQHFPDGYVQVSTDNFATSTLASLNNTNNTWTASIPSSTGGTVCARQVLAKDLYTPLWDDVQAGPVACVNFGPPIPIDVVSHKIHGASSPFDIHLLPPNPGIEMRRNTGADVSPAPNAGRDHELIITFPVAVTASSVTVTTNVPGDTPAPTGNIVAGNGTANLTVDLHNIQNPRNVTVTLNSVTGAGNGPGPVTVLFGALLGDVNSNKLVNSTDTSIVQSQSGKPVGNSNFPSDVNVNGLINSTDTSIVQSKSGTGLP